MSTCGIRQSAQSALQQLAKLAPNLAYQPSRSFLGKDLSQAPCLSPRRGCWGNVFIPTLRKGRRCLCRSSVKYKDVIEVDYSANYIASDSSLYVIRTRADISWSTIPSSPKKISVSSYGDKFSTNYELDGRISDAGGNTIYQYMKEFPLSFSGAEIQDLGAKTMAIQDLSLWSPEITGSTSCSRTRSPRNSPHLKGPSRSGGKRPSGHDASGVGIPAGKRSFGGGGIYPFGSVTVSC